MLYYNYSKGREREEEEMRIGRTMIDTDNMSIEDMDIIIKELRSIRARKVKAEELVRRMNELIADAKAEGFTFLDKDFGNVLMGTDFTVFDER